MVLHGIAWYCMVLHDIALYCMVSHCIVLNLTALHGVALYHCWLRRAGCISQDTYLLYWELCKHGTIARPKLYPARAELSDNIPNTSKYLRHPETINASQTALNIFLSTPRQHKTPPDNTRHPKTAPGTPRHCKPPPE